MFQLSLDGIDRALCLGAHSDDIEIGAGATLLQLLNTRGDLESYWVIFSAPGVRADEARASADEFLRSARSKQVIIGLEGIKAKFKPDLVLTHYRDDRHQDHRAVSDLAWNPFRMTSSLNMRS